VAIAAVAALFSQQARAFVEGNHQTTLERLNRLDERIAASEIESVRLAQVREKE